MQARSPVFVVLVLAMALLLAACSAPAPPGFVKIPFFSVTIKAVDEKDQPLPSAIVESSDGQQVTTGADGLATIKFGSLGAHTVTVMAQDRAPSTFTVSMPGDRGKTMTARLGQPVQMSANVNVSIGAGGGGYLGGLMAGQLYPVLFQSLFAAYGYNMDLATYQPGEWSEWQVTAGDDDDDQMVMRKAFLTRLENKQEWWQVMLLDEKQKEEDRLTLEVLFSKDRDSLRRMREQTGKQPPREVPVSEGWYTHPMSQTPESLEGAVTKRGVKVQVPAGSFQADLIEFSTFGEVTLRMWRVKEVPGGVVKAELVGPDGKSAWLSQLRSHGQGAKTALNSY